MISGFQPIIAKQPKIMILGSMPSVVSLDKQEYYGFKHNRFWKIIANYFDCELKDYQEKKQCMMQNHIILWDVIKSCEREGSLDSNIKNVEVNDIEQLIKKYSTIKTVLCNGKKSYSLYMKYFSQLEVDCICLPSTSNANRSIKEMDLYKIWNQALDNAYKKA